jgi:hypothetical protein
VAAINSKTGAAMDGAAKNRIKALILCPCVTIGQPGGTKKR